MPFNPIRVLARPKKNGLGTHFGVEFSSGEIYDYTLDEGLRRVSMNNFKDGSAVTVVREIPWHQGLSVRARLEELARNPRKYDLLSWNCETFAEWLTSGVPKSSQVISGLILIGIVLLVAIAAK